MLFSYVSDLQTLAFSLGLAPLIFLGAAGLYFWLKWFFPFIRPMLALNAMEFKKFRDRNERYANSFLPYLFVALVFFFCFRDVFNELELMLVGGLELHAVWHFVFSFFTWLLIATGVWTIISMWLAVFSMSRQPLNLELSPKTFKDFRLLGLVSLNFSLFYFLGISIGVFFPPPGALLLLL